MKQSILLLHLISRKEVHITTEHPFVVPQGIEGRDFPEEGSVYANRDVRYVPPVLVPVTEGTNGDEPNDLAETMYVKNEINAPPGTILAFLRQINQEAAQRNEDGTG